MRILRTKAGVRASKVVWGGRFLLILSSYWLPLSLLSLSLLVVSACGTRKNTAMSRFYHQTTSYFNYYFNANDAYQQGIRAAQRGTQYDYTRPLPLELIGLSNAAMATDGQMDRVVEKCAMLIKLHSIVAKPERKPGTLTAKERKFYSQTEYNKYVRKAWLLIGKAHLWNAEYDEAGKALAFAQQQYAGQFEGWEANVLISRLEALRGDLLQAESRLRGLLGVREYIKERRARFLVNAVYADLLLKQDRYREALPMVVEALACSRRGRERDRVAMVLGQVREQLGDQEGAMLQYRTVARKTNDYALGFNAKLRMVSLAARTGGQGMERNLERMARDVKNTDYFDQIYYALSEIAFAHGDSVRGVELLLESAHTSVKNAEQKTLSYLSLGEYYYGSHDYLRAATFYDSAIRVMPSTYPSATTHEARGLALRKLSAESLVVKSEDSLQRVASMSASERMDLIQREIERVKEAKHQEEMAHQQEMQDRQFAMQNQFRNGGEQSATSGSTWYFYNPATLSFGRQDFRLKWGDRKLEDNWRRSNRQAGIERKVDDTVRDGKEKLSNLSVAYYLHDLPLTDSARQASDARIADALLALGEIYLHDIQDSTASARVYQQLADRYPLHPRAPEALYRAYRAVEGMTEGALTAASLRSRILRDYSQSHYARMLSDPAYLVEQRRERDTLERMYSQAFQLWQSGERAQARQLSREGRERAHGHEDIEERFDLLNALSQGEAPGAAEQVAALRQFAKAHPSSESGRYADGVVRMAEKRAVALADGSLSEPAESAGKVEPASDDGGYRYQADTVHWVMLVTPKLIDIQQSKFAILSFYVDYDINLTLQTDFEPFSDDFSFLLVKEFTNGEAALKFIDALAATDPFGDLGFTPRYCVVTPANYSEMLNSKSLSGYLTFFDTHYRGKQGE